MNRIEQFNRDYLEVKEQNLESILLEIKMPTGEIETIINPNVEGKVSYINNTYDEDLRHKNCSQIQIQEYMFITKQTFDFGWALCMLKDGFKVRRKGWNGKGIFIELQRPDEYSKMTHPYIFIDTTGLKTNNPDAPKDRVPWLASQTDMLAEDWEVVE